MALCSAFLFITLSSKAQVFEPGQVYYTGNIVQTTPQGGPTPWVNGVYQNNLTCWGWGDPGYCGPNAIVRPGNNINFSWGQTDLYQSQAVANFIPTGVSGLRVNGYNFSFTAKNGNGWDNGQTDYLTAYVHFKDPSNKVLEYDSYNLTYKYNWTNFNFSKDFTTPYSVSSLGNVTYGFVGRDSNGWAGPYGPEINNVSFSLKYSVDPCASNVLSSPTCPGYFEALAKLSPPVTTSTVVVVEPVATVTQPTITSSTPVTTTTSTVAVDTGTPTTQTTSTSSSTPVTNISQQTTIAQSAPSAAPAKVGEVSDSGGGSSKTTVSLSSVLSMIGSNQEKTAALEKSVVQAADAQAFSAGETAKQTAEKIAGDAQSQSIAISNSQTAGATQTSSTQSFSGPGQNSGLPLQGNLQSNTMFNSARLEQSLASVNTGQVVSSSSMSTGILQNTQNDNKQDFVFSVPQTIAYVPKIDSSSKLEINTGIQMPKYEPPTTTENIGLQVPVTTIGRTQVEVKQDIQSTTQITMLPPVKYEPPKFEPTITSVQSSQYQPPVFKQDIIVSMVSSPPINYSLITPTRQSQVQIETPTIEGIKFGHKGPVDNAMEYKPFLPIMNTGSQQSDTVKKNVQNNELAGGVAIESIARQPANYAQYFTMIPDAAFYEPKEIYKNQKTIDNARVLRGLTSGSDAKHQEMINQQYRLVD